MTAPTTRWKQQYHLDTKPAPVLDTEEIYKRYLEDILYYDDADSSRGEIAQARLDQLRDTHPELFL